MGGRYGAAGVSSSVRSVISPNRSCRISPWPRVVGFWAVAFDRGGGRGGISSRAHSLRALVEDDRCMIVPTFGGLVHAWAGSLLACSGEGGRDGGARPGRSRSRSVRVALRRFGFSRSRLHRTSNSASVAASAGLITIASVSSAMASEIFCGGCFTVKPIYTRLVGLVGDGYRCCGLVLLECSVIRWYRFSVAPVYLLASV